MGKTEDIIKTLNKNNKEIFELQIVTIEGKRNRFKWLLHQEKYNDFLNLISDYNIKVKDYNDNYKESCQNYLKFYNVLKQMEDNENEANCSPEKFLTSEIQKEINSFRKVKAELISELNESSNKLDECSRFNLKEKLKMRVAISKATRTLKKFKYVRKDIKNKMKEKSIITSDTFLHSIYNHKDKDECTGIVGSLQTVQNYLNDYKDNENWKSLSFKSIISMKKLLNNSPKSYESSKKTFELGRKMYDKFNEDQTKSSDEVDVNNMKEQLNLLKKEMDIFIEDSVKDIMKIKSNLKVESCAKTIQQKFDVNKTVWNNDFGSHFKQSENLETFMDIYFQTRSPLMLKKRFSGLSMILGMFGFSGATSGVTLIIVAILESEIELMCMPLLALAFGIILLSSAIALDRSTSSYLGKDHREAIMKAREKVSKTQNGNYESAEDKKKEEQISPEKDKKAIEDEPEKKKSSGIRRFMSHFKKDEKVKEDDKESKKPGRVHRLIKRFERNKKIINKGMD